MKYEPKEISGNDLSEYIEQSIDKIECYDAKQNPETIKYGLSETIRCLKFLKQTLDEDMITIDRKSLAKLIKAEGYDGEYAIVRVKEKLEPICRDIAKTINNPLLFDYRFTGHYQTLKPLDKYKKAYSKRC